MSNWFLWAAIVFALLKGFELTFNKYILSTHLDDDATITLCVNFVMVVVAGGVAVAAGTGFPRTLRLWGAYALMGVLFAIPVYLYIRALSGDDATAVTTLSSMEALLLPLFAVIFLGEIPTAETTFAILLIALGILIVAVTKDAETGNLTVNRAFWLILLAVLLWAAEDTVLNAVIAQTTVADAFVWTRVFSFLVTGIVFGRQAAVRTQVRTVLQARERRLIAALVISGVASALASLAIVYAYAGGLMSIVGPIASTYVLTAFLFVAAFHIAGHPLEERTSRHALLKKGLGATLAFSGIALLW